MLLFEQMVVLLLIMGVGFFCYKRNIITDEVTKKLSALVIFVANPALILSSGMSKDKIEGSELALMFALSAIVYAALILLAWLLPIVIGVKKHSRGAYRVMTVFPNIVFMGFPLILAVWGEGALLYATPFIIFFNVLIYTYGIGIMRQGLKRDGEDRPRSPKLRVREIFNIGVIACIVSLAIYLSGIEMPSVVIKTASQLGSLTAPISMLIIGASLATMDLAKLFLDIRLIVFCVVRLVAVPLAGVSVLKLFIDSTPILGVCMVMLATPVASMTSMLAGQYGGDSDTTVRGVALSTILSALTMPLVQILLGLA